MSQEKIASINEKLASGKKLIGTGVTFTDSSITELLCDIGYDFIWIDTEHTAIEKESLLLHIMATRGTRTAAFVRVAGNDPVIVKPILEMDPDGIIFPFIRTADDAKRAVAACLYPPAGIRGFGPRRATQYGLKDKKQYVEEADSYFWRIMQIEHTEAVENLEEILAVEGVDAVAVGPNDLSGSIGLLGQTGHRRVKDLMDQIAEVASGSDIPLGVALGDDPDVLKEWLDRGIDWVRFGLDVGLLSGAGRKAISEAEKTIDSSER